jgi:hypothetical protein
LVLREPCGAGARVLISGRAPRGEVLLQPRGVLISGRGVLISGRAPRGEVLLQPRGVVDRRAGHLEVKECAAALGRALARAPALEVEGDAVLAVARLPPHEALRRRQCPRLGHLVGGGRRETLLQVVVLVRVRVRVRVRL